MDENIIEGLRNFDSVWQRVSGHSCPEVRAAKGLEDFIRSSGDSAALYSALAKKSGGEQSARLAAMAGAERKLLNSMQLEYFLRSGDTLPLAAAAPAPGNTLSALREEYIRQKELIRELEEAAEAADEELRGLYKGAADLKSGNIEGLRWLIGRALGV